MESHSPDDFKFFTKPLNEIFINNKLKRLGGLLWDNQVNPALSDVLGVDKSSLAEVVDMVERRRVYLHIFHRIKMSQYNEIALYCFWILKFQPFFPKGNNKKTTNEINTLIAYCLLSGCIKTARKVKGVTSSINLNLNEITHAFRYQDISKEAIMLLMVSLIEA